VGNYIDMSKPATPPPHGMSGAVSLCGDSGATSGGARFRRRLRRRCAAGLVRSAAVAGGTNPGSSGGGVGSFKLGRSRRIGTSTDGRSGAGMDIGGAGRSTYSSASRASSERGEDEPAMLLNVGTGLRRMLDIRLAERCAESPDVWRSIVPAVAGPTLAARGGSVGAGSGTGGKGGAGLRPRPSRSSSWIVDGAREPSLSVRPAPCARARPHTALAARLFGGARMRTMRHSAPPANTTLCSLRACFVHRRSAAMCAGVSPDELDGSEDAVVPGAELKVCEGEVGDDGGDEAACVASGREDVEWKLCGLSGVRGLLAGGTGSSSAGVRRRNRRFGKRASAVVRPLKRIYDICVSTSCHPRPRAHKPPQGCRIPPPGS
jgi:hypothetical protein